jgi:hypothetical protein
LNYDSHVDSVWRSDLKSITSFSLVKEVQMTMKTFKHFVPIVTQIKQKWIDKLQGTHKFVFSHSYWLKSSSNPIKVHSFVYISFFWSH